ncbi:hypothetical protein SLE2022_137470 [Rubroshorea leprosula]
MEKTLLEFQSTKGDVLPAHKFGTHDVVLLKLNKADSGSPALGQGVVYWLKLPVILCNSCAADFMCISSWIPQSLLLLMTSQTKVTYRRMKDALIQLSKGVLKGPAADLFPVLFGERLPTFSKKDVMFSPFNSNLDHSQFSILERKALSIPVDKLT